MVRELAALLGACLPNTGLEDYRAAAIDGNELFKKSLESRRGSFRRLRELYALDPSVLVFRSLRRLWDANDEARPLLAILCAVARDPILRSRVPSIVATPKGEVVNKAMFSDAVSQAFPGRYGPGVLARIGRNLASSWTQSGHLHGRVTKVRAEAQCQPISLTYALFLAHLCGERGGRLFSSQWALLLDAPPDVLLAQAAVASRSGWLDYRHGGGVTEIGFSFLMRDEVAAA